MNDRLRMLASRYYSGVWVPSIDCLTKYRIHAHNFFCASMSDDAKPTTPITIAGLAI